MTEEHEQSSVVSRQSSADDGQSPVEDHQPPVDGHETDAIRLTIDDTRLPTDDNRLTTADSGLPTADSRLTTSSSGVSLVQVKEELVAWVKTLMSAAVDAVLIVTFLFQVARVEGQSMAPTLEDQDRLIVNKLVYRIG